jgi:DegV family protein with EDD domain
MKIAIVTDSTCDLPDAVVEKYGIAVIPLNISMGENMLRDGVDISREEFYRQLPGYDPAPKTAAPGPYVFHQVYSKLFEAGATAILSIHISESLSATVNAARLAAREFASIPVTVMDSSQLSLGTGFLVERAAELALLGHKVDEVSLILGELMQRTYVFASLKTLEYLRRSGRMHIAVARIGEILKIKPLLHMNNGKPTVKRARTQRKATEQLIAWLDGYAPFERLAILHAGVQEEAEALYEHIREYLPESDVPIVQITPVLGAHLGVGALGFACISNKR